MNTHDIINLRMLGYNCKQFRISISKLQSDVAEATGYSVENISSFETGRNDNLRILLWYIKEGITPGELLRGIE